MQKLDYPVKKMCEGLSVSKSGYYKWSKRNPSTRKLENEKLVVEIKDIHRESRQTYGSPRIHDELLKRGHSCSRPRIARLMRKMGVHGKVKRKFKSTTDSNHNHAIAPKLITSKFVALKPNVAWVSDITYIPTAEGWLYLAAVMDLCSRHLIGLSMSDRMQRYLIMNAFDQAMKRRGQPNDIIIHSDRGSQYASLDYQALLKKYGARCSMGKSCYDNATMESFFHTLKTELVHHHNFQTRKEAKQCIFEYIEVFYNNHRTHSSLGYLSPRDFEVACRS